MSSNFYAVLGVLPGATQDEVKQAYVRLAKMYHPDKNRSPDATVRMAEINLAYETLRDDLKRKEYNHEIKDELRFEEARDQTRQYEEDEEMGHEEQWSYGKCARCNFVNNSGMFVCSVCDHVFDPHAGSNKSGFEPDDPEEEDALSEIIRCPQCNEINKFSSGSCWQCGLEFEIEEIL